MTINKLSCPVGNKLNSNTQKAVWYFWDLLFFTIDLNSDLKLKLDNRVKIKFEDKLKIISNFKYFNDYNQFYCFVEPILRNFSRDIQSSKSNPILKNSLNILLKKIKRGFEYFGEDFYEQKYIGNISRIEKFLQLLDNKEVKRENVLSQKTLKVIYNDFKKWQKRIHFSDKLKLLEYKGLQLDDFTIFYNKYLKSYKRYIRVDTDDNIKNAKELFTKSLNKIQVLSIDSNNDNILEMIKHLKYVILELDWDENSEKELLDSKKNIAIKKPKTKVKPSQKPKTKPLLKSKKVLESIAQINIKSETKTQSEVDSILSKNIEKIEVSDYNKIIRFLWNKATYLIWIEKLNIFKIEDFSDIEIKNIIYKLKIKDIFIFYKWVKDSKWKINIEILETFKSKMDEKSFFFEGNNEEIYNEIKEKIYLYRK